MLVTLTLSLSSTSQYKPQKSARHLSCGRQKILTLVDLVTWPTMQVQRECIRCFWLVYAPVKKPGPSCFQPFSLPTAKIRRQILSKALLKMTSFSSSFFLFIYLFLPLWGPVRVIVVVVEDFPLPPGKYPPPLCQDSPPGRVAPPFQHELTT